MPRDAPLPADVAELQIIFTTNDWPWSVRHYVRFDDLEAATSGWALSLLTQVALTVPGPYLSVMHSGVRVRACRLIAAGIPYALQTIPFQGAHRGGQANVVVATLHWITLDPSHGGRFLTHLSGVPASFTTDELLLTDSAIADVTDAATEVLNALSGLPSPIGTAGTFVGVRRRTKDGPLPASIITPIVGLSANFTLSTMRRRAPASGKVPPHFHQPA